MFRHNRDTGFTEDVLSLNDFQNRGGRLQTVSNNDGSIYHWYYDPKQASVLLHEIYGPRMRDEKGVEAPTLIGTVFGTQAMRSLIKQSIRAKCPKRVGC